ncbi:MAG TPA: AI-2E family transporter [Thermomicrobiales bacterium]|nr:AI-2E family transporter [Thermomicrobiales bacterium]
MSATEPTGHQEPIARADAPPGRDPAPVAPPPLTRVRIELPTRTIVQVLATIVIVSLFLEVRGTLFVIVMGMFIALVLDGPVGWLHRRGLPRPLAITVVLGAAVGGLALLLANLIPPLVDQLREFWDQLPTYVEESLAWLQRRQPGLYDVILEWSDAQREGLTSGGVDLQGVFSQGVDVFSSMANIVIALIVAVYFLADQGRTIDPLIALLPPRPREKLRRTIPAVARVINGYVAGQTFNSTLFALFTLIVLSTLDVPSAGVLALIAAIGDAIPQVGVTLATIPAVLLSLTVSFQTAIIVLIAYIVYQQIENYVTSPRVFGKTLDLPPLITMIAILIGGGLMGIIGVLLALPVAAAIPVIVRIWTDDEPAAS